jgi:hypothetical protein
MHVRRFGERGRVGRGVRRSTDCADELAGRDGLTRLDQHAREVGVKSVRAVVVVDRDGLPVPAEAGLVLANRMPHNAGACSVHGRAFVAG